MKLKTKRTIAAVGLLGLVGVGLAVHTGTGTPSAWGIGDIAAICPLGAVEAAIASRTIVPPLLIGLVIVIVLAAAAGVFAYTQGYGYPTVQTVTQELFSDPSGAADKVFSADVDKDAIPAMLDPVVTDSNVTIDGVSRSMTESTVYATAKTEEGGSVQYRISMVRDGITWKVSNVELYFPSQA